MSNDPEISLPLAEMFQRAGVLEGAADVGRRELLTAETIGGPEELLEEMRAKQRQREGAARKARTDAKAAQSAALDREYASRKAALNVSLAALGLKPLGEGRE